MKETEINIIGFIGLGVMGGSMCKNLLKNNQWDILINDLKLVYILILICQRFQKLN